jgi:hypothetical protein
VRCVGRPEREKSEEKVCGPVRWTSRRCRGVGPEAGLYVIRSINAKQYRGKLAHAPFSPPLSTTRGTYVVEGQCFYDLGRDIRKGREGWTRGGGFQAVQSETSHRVPMQWVLLTPIVLAKNDKLGQFARMLSEEKVPNSKARI